MQLMVPHRDLDATNLDATNLDVTNLDATNLDATNLDVTNLDATNLDATNLDATNLDATNLASNSSWYDYSNCCNHRHNFKLTLTCSNDGTLACYFSLYGHMTM